MLSVLKENTAQIMEDRDVEEINYNAVRCAKCCYFYFLCEYVFLFMCEYVLFLLFLPFELGLFLFLLVLKNLSKVWAHDPMGNPVASLIQQRKHPGRLWRSILQATRVNKKDGPPNPLSGPRSGSL